MTDLTSNPQHEFNRLYRDISASIGAAIADIDLLDAEYKEGQQEIGDILARLRAIQVRFDGELGLLEEHAEWEKFTIAFFGETNAGKSTIIESLRILFNEESRQQLLAQNAGELVRYEQALAGHVDTVRHGLMQAHAAYAAAIAALRLGMETQTASLLSASAAHSAKTRHELAVLEGALREAVSTRAQLDASLAQVRQEQLAGRSEFAQALARSRQQTWLAAAAGCLFGGTALALISLVWR